MRFLRRRARCGGGTIRGRAIRRKAHRIKDANGDKNDHERDQLERETRLIVDAMLEDKGFQLLREAHWDDGDRTAIDGPIAISRTTGQVRVIAMWKPR